MKEAIQTIEAANTGIEAMYDLLDQMKSLASAAKTSDNTTDLASQYNAIRSQITDLASDSNYGGKNLLNGETLQVEFDEDAIHKLTVSGFTATSTGDDCLFWQFQRQPIPSMMLISALWQEWKVPSCRLTVPLPE
jgi:flagellin